MADSKLKLQIVTALDNAGIKATEQQINGMVASIERSSKATAKSASSAFGDVDGAVNKAGHGIKTFLKDVAIGVGLAKTVGTAATKIFEDTQIKGKETGEAIKDYFSDVSNTVSKFIFGTSVKEQFDSIAQAAKDSADFQAKSITGIIDKLQKQAASIDDVTNRYIKQMKSVQGLDATVNDAEVLLLQREKLQQVENARAMYGDEAATQLASMYDMKIAAYQNQHIIEAAEDEQLIMQQQLEATADKLKANEQSITKVKAQLEAAKKLYDASGEDALNATKVGSLNLDGDGFMGLMNKFSRGLIEGVSDFVVPGSGKRAYNWVTSLGIPDKEELESEIKSGRLQAVHAAEKALATLNSQREKLIEQQQLDENAIQAQSQKIANLSMNAAIAIAKMDWDNINRIQATGGNMYYDWTKEAAEHIDNFSSDAYRNIERTAENTDDLATMLKKLLQIKQ